MLKIIFLPVFCLLVFSAIGQVQTQVVGDSVYIHGNTGKSELILQNSTDSVNGYLYNKGNGRTEFRRGLIYLGNNKYLIGLDTLDLSSASNNSDSLGGEPANYYAIRDSAWSLNGNSNATASNFIGPTGNYPLKFYSFQGPSGFTGGSNSASFGWASYKYDTAIAYSFSDNTAFGVQSLAALTKSSANVNTGNVAVGYSALQLAKYGYDNIAVGPFALWGQNVTSNTNFRSNVAVGHLGLWHLTNGIGNIAIGDSVFNSLTSGNYNIGLGDKVATSLSTLNNTIYISDSTYHLNFKLDSATGSAPSVIGKDAAGNWHVYQTPSGGSGGGTVTNVATGYGLTGGPITTTGTIEVDSSALHQTFLGTADSTIYYPFASNPKGFLTSSNAWKTTGNSGTDTTTSGNFIGTTDNRRLIFKVNNQVSGYIDQINHSTSFGYQALPIASNSIFTHSTAFGFRTFGSELASSSGGNTGVGAYAGYYTTSGQNNAAIGFTALYKNTTGSNSVAIGSGALYNNTVSNNNVAVGGASLIASTIGYSNTAVGAYSLNSSTTGVRNSSLGDSSFLKLVNGSFDIGLGWYAGGTNSTLSNTLAVGDSTYHFYMQLDSSANVAPNVLGKDANGYWHVYQTPSGGSGGGSGTVTNIATGYGLAGGPITTSGTIVVDSAVLHQQFLGIADSTIYYPFASNPKGYLSAANAWGTSGNAGTTSSNFIGTTDNIPLQFKINNTLAGSIGTGTYGNVSYGGLSLPSTSTGNSLVAIGTGALHSNRNGSLNVAVGQEPLYYNLGGSYNTAVGYISQAWDSSGIGNTTIGALSMNQAGGGQHKGGSYNSALGYGALGDNWNNNYNIGIGHDAGLASTKSNTFYISDSTYHMYMKLDSTTGTAPSVIGKDANGNWHVYQTPTGGSGGLSNDPDSLGGQAADYYASVVATQAALDTKANDSNVVHISGNETIAGIKLVPTPLSNDSSKQVVNSEWVKQNYAFLTRANVFTGSNTFKNPITTIGQASINSELHIVGYGGDDINHRTSWAVKNTGVDVDLGTYSPQAYFHLDWYGGFNLEHFSKSYVDPSNLGFDQTTFAIGSDPTPGATLDILNNGNHRALPPMRFRYSSSDVLKDTLVSGAVEVYKDSIYYTGLNLTRKRLAFADELGGGSGSGTVTSVATGYGLSGGPVTTTGTINVDSATLHLKFMGLDDSTVYYPYASNPKGYLTSIAVQEDASDLTPRSKVNFNYGVLASDNSGTGTTDVNVNLSNASNFLSSDISMSSSGTFYDGGSVTLAAGTWLLSGSGTIESGNNTAIKITGKIWDGTTVYTAGENSVGAMGGGNKGYVALSMNTIVTITSTTTISLSFASNTSGCTLKATPTDNNSGTTGTATSITAVRIK